MDTIIKVRNLEVKYNKKLVLKRISFNVKRNNITGFLGPNGAGKTTTIKTILGFIKPNGGTIEIIGEAKKKDEAFKNIGYVPEAPQFFPFLKGEEILYFTARLVGLEKSRINKEIERITELLGLQPFIKEKVYSYSFGTIKKLSFAQAILCNPRLLIIDEPYNGLDPISINRVRNIIKELKDEGVTIFVSSHLLSEMERICDYAIFIDNGRIIVEDKIDNLKLFYKTFLFLKSHPELRKIVQIDENEKFDFKVYNKISNNYQPLIEMFSKDQISEIYKIDSSLEEIFLNLVEKE